MRLRPVLFAAVMAVLAILAPSRAWASFHLIDIVEVFPGSAASPNAQYVKLQMYAAGQTFLSGHAIDVYDSSGNLLQSFTFAGNVANGTDQAMVLIATSEAQAYFGVTADLTMTAVLPLAGGKVCWAGTIDCVAWGDYTASSTGVGNPFNPAAGLVLDQAMERRLDIAGSPSTLDVGDDTNDCANDFRLSAPVPTNNAGQTGIVPGADAGSDAAADASDDASADASSDAALDADAAPDAQADAGPADAAPADATAPADAASPDAAPKDGGGAIDAGSHDAGTTLPDAASPGSRDASAGADAAAGNPASGGDDSGCGCRLGATSPPAYAGAAFAALAALGLARRRRRDR